MDELSPRRSDGPMLKKKKKAMERLRPFRCTEIFGQTSLTAGDLWNKFVALSQSIEEESQTQTAANWLIWEKSESVHVCKEGEPQQVWDEER